jgi:adenosine kinase
MKIAITGSIAYDYIMTFPGEFKEMILPDSLDHLSVSFLVDEMSKHRGGVAANIAYTLALLGEHPLLIAAAGCDFDEYRTKLEIVGVDTGGVRAYDDLYTASFFVSTDRSNNQIASFYGGAMSRAKDLDLIGFLQGEADLAIVSPNDPTAMHKYVSDCKQAGIRYMYDPSQQVARFGGEELTFGVEGAEIVIVNEYEHSALCKKTGLSQADILSKARILIITRGISGAEIFIGSDQIHIPIFPTDKIVDPTGVGDAFRAGLLRGMSAGFDWALCGEIGALAAAYVLEEKGPQNHSFTMSEFVGRFRQHFDDGGKLDELLTK